MSGTDKGPRSRRWAFTQHEVGCDIYELRKLFLERVGGLVVYLVMGVETCPETGRRHIQGFVHLKQQVYLTRVKSLFGRNDMHAEVAKGSDIDNQKYCTKQDEKAVQVGSPSTQGRRTDIEQAIAAAKNAAEFREQNPGLFVKYAKGVEAYFNLERETTMLNSFNHNGLGRAPPKVFWFYGPTGTGKTYEVHKKEPLIEGLWKRPGEKIVWFDGYHGQEAVIFDDFRPGQCNFAFLLQLLDRYMQQVPVKGGFVWWYPKRIYITTPKNIQDTYKRTNEVTGEEWHREDLDQLERRVTDIWRFRLGEEPVIEKGEQAGQLRYTATQEITDFMAGTGPSQ